MVPTIEINFDSGSAGQAIAAGGDIAAVWGAPTYSLAAIHGSLAAQCGQNEAVLVNFSQLADAMHAGSVYVRPGELATNSVSLLRIAKSGNNTIVAVRQNDDGLIDITDGGTRIAATVGSWTAGQSLRLDWQYDTTTPTNPVFTLRVFFDAESTTYEQLQYSPTITAGDEYQFTFGALGSVPVGYSCEIDSIRLYDTLTWPASYTIIAQDSFTRTVSGDWGTADIGGAWLVGAPAGFSVNGSSGQVLLGTAGQGLTAVLSEVAVTAADLQVEVTFATARTGGGIYSSLELRSIDKTNSYIINVNVNAVGKIGIKLVRVESGVNNVLISDPDVGSFADSGTLLIRGQIRGTKPTYLQGKAWIKGQTEPDWQVAAVDNTSGFQVAAPLAVTTYVSEAATTLPFTTNYDNLLATRLSAYDQSVSVWNGTSEVVGQLSVWDGSMERMANVGDKAS